MGLLRLPLGLQIRRGYAPADIARSPLESEAPELWDDALALPLFGGLRSVGLSTAGATSSGFARTMTRFGRAYHNSTPSSSPVITATNVLATNIAELTVVLWVIPDTAAQANSTTNSFTLAANSTSNTDGFRIFSDMVGTHVARWRLPEAAGNVDIASPGWSAGKLLQCVGRLGAGAQDFDIYDLSGNHWHASAATTATITFSNTSLFIGNADGGYLGSWPGSVVYAYLQFRRWTDGEIEHNRIAPFAMFRRRPLLVPVGGASSGTSASWAAAAAAGYGFAPTVTAPVAFATSASAGDQSTAIAQVAGSLTAAVAAGDSDLGAGQALAAVSARATGDAVVDAGVQAAAALVQGASAGESWAAHAEAVAALLSGTLASDTEASLSAGVYARALTAGTAAGAQFVAAVQALAGLSAGGVAGFSPAAGTASHQTASSTEGARAAATISVLLAAIAAIGEGAIGSDRWDAAVGALAARLTAGAGAGAIQQARGAAVAAWNTAALAGAVFSLATGGYLVAGAITLVAALSGSIQTDPALSGAIELQPKVDQ